MNKIIDSFTDKYAFLSNFAICTIEYEGRIFTSVESAFQSAKCLCSLDKDDFQHMSPREAKKRGRRVALRHDWEDVKFSIMEDLLRRKFSIPEFRELLLSTEDAILIEGNHWNDTIWGVCNGVGENNLGKLLMKIRDEIRKEIENYE